MTFLELCELTYEKANRRPMAFSSVNLGHTAAGWVVPDPEMRAAIRAVQDAFDYILGLSSHWEFLQRRGKLLSILSGVSTYARPYSNVDWSSLYIKRAGSPARYPLIQQTYTQWELGQQVQDPASGIPYFLVEAPQFNWIFWPTPAEDLELWGDGQLYRPKLLKDDDEPPWDSDQHSIVSDVALRILEQRIDSTDQMVQQLNVQVSGQSAQHRMASLIRDYTRGFG